MFRLYISFNICFQIRAIQLNFRNGERRLYSISGKSIKSLLFRCKTIILLLSQFRFCFLKQGVQTFLHGVFGICGNLLRIVFYANKTSQVALYASICFSSDIIQIYIFSLKGSSCSFTKKMSFQSDSKYVRSYRLLSD